MRKIVLLVFLIAAGSHLSAQSVNTGSVAMPSANNSFLGASGSILSTTNVDVDLYTGSAQIGAKICELKAKDITIPVSINYSGGQGIRLQDYASCVGLGWQLNAGGCITRVVRGYPDEGPNGFVYSGWGNLIKGWTGYNTCTQGNISLSQFEAITGEGEPDYAPTADGEPDLFNVQTPFFTFQFVLDGNGTPQVDNSNGISIIYNRSAQSFVVTDDQGNQYFFGGTSPFTTPNTTTETTSTTFYGNVTNYVSAWYLNKIVTFNSKDVINLTYTSGGGNDITYFYEFSEWQIPPGTGNPVSMDSVPQEYTVLTPLSVSSITSNAGEVDFSYAWDRQDDNAAARLTSIILKAWNPATLSNSTTLQTYTFNSSYFGSSYAPDATVLRLRLDNISVTGNTTGTSTPLTLESFSYNQTNTMPSRKSPAYDYWGFCSVLPSGYTPLGYMTLSGQLHTPNTAMAETYILQNISDLYGDNWAISYESNDFGASNTIAGGLRVKQISRTENASGVTLTKTYAYKDATGNSSGTIFSSAYNQVNVQFAATAEIWYSSSPYVINDINDVFVGYSTVTVTDENGGSTVYSFSNFNTANDILTATIPSSTSSYVVTSSTSLAYQRGLLTNEVFYAAGNPNPIKQIASFYHSQITATPNVYAFHPVNLGYLVGISVPGYATYYLNQDSYRLVKTVETDYDQIQSGNSLVKTTTYQYSSVNHRLLFKRIATSPKGSGTSVTTYEQDYYHPDDAASLTLPGGTSEQQALAAMASANRTNVVIQETDTRNGIVHEKHDIYGSFSSGTGTNIYPVSTYLYTGTALVQQQGFVFDPTASQLITTSAPGDKSTAFVYDYNSVYPTAKIVNASSQIEVNTTQSVQSTAINVVPGSQSFTSSYAGTINLNFHVPTGAGPFNVAIAIVNSSGTTVATQTICYSNPATCNPNGTYTSPSLPAGTYTVSAQPVGTSNTTGWTINISYPYTFVTSTTTNEFFYQGFEQSGTSSSQAAHSGINYYDGNYTVPYTPPNSRSYIIQWWNLVSGSWVFNQQPYTTGMTLTGPVDDVRVFPADAVMTTYTYNPLVGKTSETDPGGHTQTFEYDGLNRLLRVRDQDGNIVKQYTYGYQTPLHQ